VFRTFRSSTFAVLAAIDLPGAGVVTVTNSDHVTPVRAVPLQIVRRQVGTLKLESVRISLDL